MSVHDDVPVLVCVPVNVCRVDQPDAENVRRCTRRRSYGRDDDASRCHETVCEVSLLRDADTLVGAIGPSGRDVNDRDDDHGPYPAEFWARTRTQYCVFGFASVCVRDRDVPLLNDDSPELNPEFSANCT